MLLAAQDPTLPDSKKMTVDEVLAQSVIFLIAGYETSSTTLGFVCYSLATNADIQEKLQKEIDSVWDDESKMPSYETVNELPYLDMVISETLRLYPAGRGLPSICLLSGGAFQYFDIRMVRHLFQYNGDSAD